MKNIKRRFFIKSSSLIAGGLVLPSFKIERMANNANNKKLKVSVIGCGGRGTGAAVQALRADDNVELIAMADAFEDRLENSLAAIKEEMGPSFFANWRLIFFAVAEDPVKATPET